MDNAKLSFFDPQKCKGDYNLNFKCNKNFVDGKHVISPLEVNTFKCLGFQIKKKL